MNVAKPTRYERESARAAVDMDRFGFDPLEPYPGCSKRWLAVHRDCGQETRVLLNTLRTYWTPSTPCCKACSGARIGDRSRTPQDQAIAELRAAGRQPLEPFVDVLTPWRSSCMHCGTEASPNLHNIRTRTSDSNYCKKCADARSASKKRIGADAAVASAIAAGFTPREPYPMNAHAAWRAIHNDCGREVTVRLIKINAGAAGCVHCRPALLRSMFIGDGDAAAAVMRDRGLEPLEPYSGTNRPWRCRCMKCHREVAPHFSSIRDRPDLSCRFCGRGGSKYKNGALVYLIRHPQMLAAKVGVSRTTRFSRIYDHQRHGWQVVATKRFSTGEDAFSYEDAMLGFIREDLSLPRFLDSSDMPQAGYTETFSDEATERVRQRFFAD